MTPYGTDRRKCFVFSCLQCAAPVALGEGMGPWHFMPRRHGIMRRSHQRFAISSAHFKRGDPKVPTPKAPGDRHISRHDFSVSPSLTTNRRVYKMRTQQKGSGQIRREATFLCSPAGARPALITAYAPVGVRRRPLRRSELDSRVCRLREPQ